MIIIDGYLWVFGSILLLVIIRYYWWFCVYNFIHTLWITFIKIYSLMCLPFYGKSIKKFKKDIDNVSLSRELPFHGRSVNKSVKNADLLKELPFYGGKIKPKIERLTNFRLLRELPFLI